MNRDTITDPATSKSLAGSLELRPLADHEIDEVNGGFSPSGLIWTLIRFLGGIGVL
jgi:hypothetical protein